MMQDLRVRFHPAGFTWEQGVVWTATVHYCWINLMILLQAIAVEEFEYYAVYESNLWDLGLSFLMFKPFETLCEHVLALLVAQIDLIRLR
ncbi:MAG: hypothetical protein F6K04_06765 [Leptolyngbya sp. SIO4C5]|nr:hypothetical protein [Leptolyngbya sp. SIO4C5]